jgi:hypothetical protein
MLGRALFAVVCLVIAAGLLLPVYPADLKVASRGVADARDMLITDDAGAADCAHCATAAARVVTRCLADAPAAATAQAEACVRLTVYLVVRPLPAPGPAVGPQLLAPKLPTI